MNLPKNVGFGIHKISQQLESSNFGSGSNIVLDFTYTDDFNDY